MISTQPDLDRTLRPLRRTLCSGGSHGAARGTGCAYLQRPLTPRFRAELADLLEHYAGRPTPLYFAKRLSETLGGAKLLEARRPAAQSARNKIKQLPGASPARARRMGKKRIIAETGAGQHGVATATVCALFGLECVVMAEDMRRQQLNVFRMRSSGRQGRGRDQWQPHRMQGRHRRGHAGLGDERALDVLPAWLGTRLASLSDDGPRFSPSNT